MKLNKISMESKMNTSRCGRSVLLMILSVFVGFLTNNTSAGSLELFQKDDGKTFQVSSHHPNAGDAWNVAPGEKKILADINGPAVIRNIWFTCSGLPDAGGAYMRDIVIRMYWDGEKEPSVEVPFGDFFGNSLSRRTPWQSQYLGVTSGGFYSYFPMPFAKRGVVEIENTGKKNYLVFFHFLCQRYPKLPDNTLYFHSQYRRENPTIRGRNYTILQADGEGYFAGVTLAMQAYSKGDKWNFLEGDEFVYIDGEKDASIKGTGGEDYFQGGWYFIDGVFNGLYHGLVLKDADTVTAQCYRFHILDRINFDKSIRVEIEHGQRPNNEAKADFSSTAYWYQNEPHRTFEPICEDRTPSVAKEAFFLPGAIEWEGTPGTHPMFMSTYLSGWSNNMSALFAGTVGGSTEKKFNVESDGEYIISVNYIKHANGAIAQVAIDGNDIGGVINTYAPEKRDDYLLNANHAMGHIELGMVKLNAGEHTARITITGKDEKVKAMELMIDCITVNPKPKQSDTAENTKGMTTKERYRLNRLTIMTLSGTS